MGRKKVLKDPQEELEAECKLLFDEATNLMKVHNYTKAMTIYQKVKLLLLQVFQKLYATSLSYFPLSQFSFSPQKFFTCFPKAFPHKSWQRVIVLATVFKLALIELVVFDWKKNPISNVQMNLI